MSKTLEAQIEVMQAFSKGMPVRCRVKAIGEWQRVRAPNWNWCRYEYEVIEVVEVPEVARFIKAVKEMRVAQRYRDKCLGIEACPQWADVGAGVCDAWLEASHAQGYVDELLDEAEIESGGEKINANLDH